MKEYFYLKKKDKENILVQITFVLKKRPEVVFAYCHGTFLAAEKIGFRDIDIALFLKGEKEQFKNKALSKEQEFADILEKKIKYPVDVKILNVTPFYFLNNVFRTGKLLFSRNNYLLVELIENTNRQAMVNYNFSLQSFKELIPK